MTFLLEIAQCLCLFQDFTIIFEVSGCKDVPKNQVPGSCHPGCIGFLRDDFRMLQSGANWRQKSFFFVIFVIFGWLMIIWGYQNP